MKPTVSKPSAQTMRRLADGTPFYGSLGVLTRDAEEDLVQCHLCGQWFRAIGSSHLRRVHGWTLDKYRDAFKLPRGVPTCARSVSDGQSVRASGQVKSGRLGLAPGERLAHGMPTLRPWQTLAVRNPALASELDQRRNQKLTAESLAAGSNGKVWWRCHRCGHAWEATIKSRHAGHGCPACWEARRRVPGALKPGLGASLADMRLDLVEEWDAERNLPLTPETIRLGSHQEIWWRCTECGHRWQAPVYNRSAGHGCAKCGIVRRATQRARVPFARSLLGRFPEIAAQLRDTQDEALDPANLGASSSKKVWWRCPECQHEWQALVSNRTAGKTSCPACAAQRRGRASAL